MSLRGSGHIIKSFNSTNKLCSKLWVNWTCLSWITVEIWTASKWNFNENIIKNHYSKRLQNLFLKKWQTFCSGFVYRVPLIIHVTTIRNQYVISVILTLAYILCPWGCHNILCKLGQYEGCWCPEFMQLHVISMYNTDSAIHVLSFLRSIISYNIQHKDSSLIVS